MLRSPRAACFAAVLAATLLAQFWLASGGTWRFDPPDKEFRGASGFYGMLARSFSWGRLDLPVDPPAALGALQDPFDPDARYELGALFDASWTQGRYWLYFGPAPAAAIVPLALFMDPRDVSDGALALVALLGLTAVLAAGVWVLGGRLPLSIQLLAIPACGFLMPLPFMPSRGAIYEAAIAWGQLGLVSGALLALAAPGRGGWWVAAGAAFAVALTSRISLLPAVVLLTIGLGWGLPAGRWRRLAAVGAPMAAALLALAAYNAARFGSPLETSHRFQLTGYQLQRDYGRFVSLEYLPTQLWYAFASPPLVSPKSPFLTWDGEADQRFPRPGLLEVESPLHGLLWTVPVLAFGLGFGLRSRDRTALLLAVAALAALAPSLVQRYGAIRYQADASPLLALAAMAALAAGARGRWLWPIGASLAATALIGAAYGAMGDSGHLRRQSPAIAAALGMAGRDGGWDDTQPLGVWLPLAAPFPPIGELASYSFEPNWSAPGEEALVRLRWKVSQSPAADETLRIRVLASDFREVVAIESPLRTVAWDAGPRVEETRRIRIPTFVQAPEHLRLQIALGSSPGRSVTIGPLRVQRGGMDRWAPPAGPALRFASGLIVRGAAVGPPRPDHVPVTLYWESGYTGVLDRGVRRSTLLELRDAAGRIVASTQGEPGEGWYPMGDWWPRERIVDERSIDLARPLPLGDYSVLLRVSQSGEWLRPEGNPVIGAFEVR